MSLVVKNQVVKTPEGKIKFWRSPSGRDHYHIGVWLDGTEEELNEVASVEYILHPTFKHPLRTSASRTNKFSITFWTWGMFNIGITIHFKDNSKKRITYYLAYELPRDNGGNYCAVIER